MSKAADAGRRLLPGRGFSGRHGAKIRPHSGSVSALVRFRGVFPWSACSEKLALSRLRFNVSCVFCPFQARFGRHPAEASERQGQSWPRGGQLSSRDGLSRPRDGQLSSRQGQLRPRGGQLSPRRANVETHICVSALGARKVPPLQGYLNVSRGEAAVRAPAASLPRRANAETQICVSTPFVGFLQWGPAASDGFGQFAWPRVKM